MNVFRLFLGYFAPDKIDNKFFDPKFAFKEVEVQAKSVSELVSKKKPKVSMGEHCYFSNASYGGSFCW